MSYRVKMRVRVPRCAETVLVFCASLLCVVWAAAPGTAAAATPVPMIIDTDIFTNADDVGALASALAMQHDGEAKVIAIAVNTPTYRTVAADQWKCVAAIDNFYGSASIPIGIQGAVTGADTGSPYLGSCGPLAPASAPVPDTAVKVYRQALASQANGSVAVVSIGYMGNLAALLKSRADAISSLTGTQLVQQKVSALVVMGGGYLSGNGENNLAGDQASAQYVTDNWPAKIVWSGYEVGQNVLTGQTIASAQPSNSPVRIAYQAYAGAGHAIQSWDLTAVYYAGRPTSPFLTATGPGTNTINTTSGSNVFTMGTGNQYYLKLSNTAGFQCSIESLLDTLPASPALGQISGTVVDASAGNRPLTGALVRAYDAGGNTVASAQTGANGTYTLSGLTAGCYRLGFSATGDRVPQYYNNTSMLAGAASLSLPAGAVVTGINAALGTVAPTPTPTPTPQSGSQQGQVPAVPPGSAPAVHPPAVTGQRGVTPAVSSATLRGQLIKLLTPRGKGGTIKTLLTLDGWTASFAAPTPGRLLVSWYHAQNHGRKVTVAVATVTFQQAGLTRIKVELTRQGRTLLRGAKRLTLSARASFKPLGQSATSASRQLTVGR